jgi:hypothetical protein
LPFKCNLQRYNKAASSAKVYFDGVLLVDATKAFTAVDG